MSWTWQPEAKPADSLKAALTLSRQGVPVMAKECVRNQAGLPNAQVLETSSLASSVEALRKEPAGFPFPFIHFPYAPKLQIPRLAAIQATGTVGEDEDVYADLPDVHGGDILDLRLDLPAAE